ncbi:hypothetical protein GCM10009722_15990 [Williamsia deligens]|nr:hypothetical protein [Williamsia deligens]
MDTLSTVATVWTRNGRTAIWHTDCTVGADTNRLTGAWVDPTPELARHILYRRMLLLMPGTPAPTLGDARRELVVFDAAATHAEIVGETDRLDDLHTATRTASGARRPPISWPEVPRMLNVTDLPAPPTGVTTDPLIADTIAVASWVAALANAWTSIENRRTGREHLRELHPTARPFPAIAK